MKIRTFLLLGISTYILVLIATAPARLVLNQWWPAKGMPTLTHAQGSVWDGVLWVQHRKFGAIQVGWQLDKLALLTGTLGAQLNLTGQGFDFKGYLASDSNQFEIRQAQFSAQGRVLNSQFKAIGVTLDGLLEGRIQHLQGSIASKQISSAAGQLVWEGGQIVFPVGRKTQAVNSPMMVAELSAQDQGALLSVHDGGKNAFARATLGSDGWAKLAVTRRLVDVLKLPIQGNEGPDQMAFEVSEKLF